MEKISTFNFIPFKRSIAAFVALALCLTQVFIPSPEAMAAETVADRMEVAAISADKISVPQELGYVTDHYTGSREKLVVFMQDAHANGSAQVSIAGLISHFRETYGIQTVALEGVEGELDSTLFRAYPNRQALESVFNGYMQAGELSGAAVASVLQKDSGSYIGIEDWKLYEAGVRSYLEAQRLRGPYEHEATLLREGLEGLKAQKFSHDALQLAGQLRRAEGHPGELLSVIKFLAERQRPDPETYPILSALYAKITAEEIHDDYSLDREIQELAARLKTHVRAVKDVRMFHGKLQAWKTGRLDRGGFAHYLSSILEAAEVPDLSAKLQRLIDDQDVLDSTKGQGFAAEYDAFADAVKAAVYTSAVEQDLDRIETRIHAVEKLGSLEIARAGWENLGVHEVQPVKLLTEDDDLLSFSAGVDAFVTRLAADFQPFVQFYDIAVAREKVFSDELTSLLSRGDEDKVLFLGGGFHAEGMMETLRERGISYVLIAPKISEVPEDSRYQNHMRGRVSWSEYFEVTHGRVNLFNAFSRAAVDRLLGEDPSRETLKHWRDGIIRALTRESRVGQASRYTRFLDEAVLRQANPQALGELSDKWHAELETFIQKLQVLERQNQITEAKVAELLNHPTSVAPGANASLRPDASLFPFHTVVSEAAIATQPQQAAPVIADAAAGRSELRAVFGKQEQDWSLIDTQVTLAEILGRNAGVDQLIIVANNSGTLVEAREIPMDNATLARLSYLLGEEGVHLVVNTGDPYKDLSGITHADLIAKLKAPDKAEQRKRYHVIAQGGAIAAEFDDSGELKTRQRVEDWSLEERISYVRALINVFYEEIKKRHSIWNELLSDIEDAQVEAARRDTLARLDAHEREGTWNLAPEDTEFRFSLVPDFLRDAIGLSPLEVPFIHEEGTMVNVDLDSHSTLRSNEFFRDLAKAAHETISKATAVYTSFGDRWINLSRTNKLNGVKETIENQVFPQLDRNKKTLVVVLGDAGNDIPTLSLDFPNHPNVKVLPIFLNPDPVFAPLLPDHSYVTKQPRLEGAAPVFQYLATLPGSPVRLAPVLSLARWKDARPGLTRRQRVTRTLLAASLIAVPAAAFIIAASLAEAITMQVLGQALNLGIKVGFAYAVILGIVVLAREMRIRTPEPVRRNYGFSLNQTDAGKGLENIIRETLGHVDLTLPEIVRIKLDRDIVYDRDRDNGLTLAAVSTIRERSNELQNYPESGQRLTVTYEESPDVVIERETVSRTVPLTIVIGSWNERLMDMLRKRSRIYQLRDPENSTAVELTVQRFANESGRVVLAYDEAYADSPAIAFLENSFLASAKQVGRLEYPGHELRLREWRTSVGHQIDRKLRQAYPQGELDMLRSELRLAKEVIYPGIRAGFHIALDQDDVSGRVIRDLQGAALRNEIVEAETFMSSETKSLLGSVRLRLIEPSMPAERGFVYFRNRGSYQVTYTPEAENDIYIPVALWNWALANPHALAALLQRNIYYSTADAVSEKVAAAAEREADPDGQLRKMIDRLIRHAEREVYKSEKVWKGVPNFFRGPVAFALKIVLPVVKAMDFIAWAALSIFLVPGAGIVNLLLYGVALLAHLVTGETIIARQVRAPSRSGLDLQQWLRIHLGFGAETRTENVRAVLRDRDRGRYPILIKALLDEEAVVRRAAAEAVGELNLAGARFILRRVAANDRHPLVRSTAAEALVKLKTASRPKPVNLNRPAARSELRNVPSQVRGWFRANLDELRNAYEEHKVLGIVELLGREIERARTISVTLFTLVILPVTLASFFALGVPLSFLFGHEVAHAVVHGFFITVFIQAWAYILRAIGKIKERSYDLRTAEGRQNSAKLAGNLLLAGVAVTGVLLSGLPIHIRLILKSALHVFLATLHTFGLAPDTSLTSSDARRLAAKEGASISMVFSAGLIDLSFIFLAGFGWGFVNFYEILKHNYASRPDRAAKSRLEALLWRTEDISMNAMESVIDFVGNVVARSLTWVANRATSSVGLITISAFAFTLLTYGFTAALIAAVVVALGTSALVFATLRQFGRINPMLRILGHQYAYNSILPPVAYGLLRLPILVRDGINRLVGFSLAAITGGYRRFQDARSVFRRRFRAAKQITAFYALSIILEAGVREFRKPNPDTIVIAKKFLQGETEAVYRQRSELRTDQDAVDPMDVGFEPPAGEIETLELTRSAVIAMVPQLVLAFEAMKARGLEIRAFGGAVRGLAFATQFDYPLPISELDIGVPVQAIMGDQFDDMMAAERDYEELVSRRERKMGHPIEHLQFHETPEFNMGFVLRESLEWSISKFWLEYESDRKRYLLKGKQDWVDDLRNKRLRLVGNQFLEFDRLPKLLDQALQYLRLGFVIDEESLKAIEQAAADSKEVRYEAIRKEITEKLADVRLRMESVTADAEPSQVLSEFYPKANVVRDWAFSGPSEDDRRRLVELRREYLTTRYGSEGALDRYKNGGSRYEGFYHRGNEWLLKAPKKGALLPSMVGDIALGAEIGGGIFAPYFTVSHDVLTHHGLDVTPEGEIDGSREWMVQKVAFSLKALFYYLKEQWNGSADEERRAQIAADVQLLFQEWRRLVYRGWALGILLSDPTIANAGLTAEGDVLHIGVSFDQTWMRFFKGSTSAADLANNANRNWLTQLFGSELAREWYGPGLDGFFFDVLWPSEGGGTASRAVAEDNRAPVFGPGEEEEVRAAFLASVKDRSELRSDNRTETIYDRLERKEQQAREILRAQYPGDLVLEDFFRNFFAGFSVGHLLSNTVTAERLAHEISLLYEMFIEYIAGDAPEYFMSVKAFNPDEIHELPGDADFTTILVMAQNRKHLHSDVEEAVEDFGVRVIERHQYTIFNPNTQAEVSVFAIEVEHKERKGKLSSTERDSVRTAIEGVLLNTMKHGHEEVRLAGSSKLKHAIKQATAAPLRTPTDKIEDVALDIYAELRGTDDINNPEKVLEILNRDLKRFNEAIKNILRKLEFLPKTLGVEPEQVKPIREYLEALQTETLQLALIPRISVKQHRQDALSIFLHIVQKEVDEAMTSDDSISRRGLTLAQVRFVEAAVYDEMQKSFSYLDMTRHHSEEAQLREAEAQVRRFKEALARALSGDRGESIEASLENLEAILDGSGLDDEISGIAGVKGAIADVARDVIRRIGINEGGGMSAAPIVEWNEGQEPGQALQQINPKAEYAIIQAVIPYVEAAERNLSEAKGGMAKKAAREDRARAHELRTIFDDAAAMLVASNGYDAIDSLGTINEKQPVVLFAHGNLNPFKLKRLFLRYNIVAIVANKGTVGSHWVFVAEQRAKAVPVLFLDSGETDVTGDTIFGHEVIVDGGGTLILDPSEDTKEEYKPKIEKVENYAVVARALAQRRTGISVAANADTPEEVENAVENGAEHIGLVRTEYLFGMDNRPLREFLRAYVAGSEDLEAKRQALVDEFEGTFRELALSAQGREVTIRMYDFANPDTDSKTAELVLNQYNPDKKYGPAYYKTPIGRALLEIENEAALRANARLDKPTIKVLFPLFRHPVDLARYLEIEDKYVADGGLRDLSMMQIYKLSKLYRADAEFMDRVFNDVKKRLLEPEGGKPAPIADAAKQTKVKGTKEGIMLEMIEGISLLNILVDLFDFISIGTNDLTVSLFRSYGITRDGNRYLSQIVSTHLNPVVLRAIAYIAGQAKSAGVSCSVCGTLGGFEQFLPFAIGLDNLALSVSLGLIPELKHEIRGLEKADAEIFRELYPDGEKYDHSSFNDELEKAAVKLAEAILAGNEDFAMDKAAAEVIERVRQAQQESTEFHETLTAVLDGNFEDTAESEDEYTVEMDRRSTAGQTGEHVTRTLDVMVGLTGVHFLPVQAFRPFIKEGMTAVLNRRSFRGIGEATFDLKTVKALDVLSNRTPGYHIMELAVTGDSGDVDEFVNAVLRWRDHRADGELFLAAEFVRGEYTLRGELPAEAFAAVLADQPDYKDFTAKLEVPEADGGQYLEPVDLRDAAKVAGLNLQPGTLLTFYLRGENAESVLGKLEAAAGDSLEPVEEARVVGAPREETARAFDFHGALEPRDEGKVRMVGSYTIGDSGIPLEAATAIAVKRVDYEHIETVTLSFGEGDQAITLSVDDPFLLFSAEISPGTVVTLEAEGSREEVVSLIQALEAITGAAANSETAPIFNRVEAPAAEQARTAVEFFGTAEDLDEGVIRVVQPYRAGPDGIPPDIANRIVQARGEYGKITTANIHVGEGDQAFAVNMSESFMLVGAEIAPGAKVELELVGPRDDVSKLFQYLETFFTPQRSELRTDEETYDSLETLVQRAERGEFHELFAQITLDLPFIDNPKEEAAKKQLAALRVLIKAADIELPEAVYLAFTLEPSDFEFPSWADSLYRYGRSEVNQSLTYRTRNFAATYDRWLKAWFEDPGNPRHARGRGSLKAEYDSLKALGPKRFREVLEGRDGGWEFDIREEFLTQKGFDETTANYIASLDEPEQPADEAAGEAERSELKPRGAIIADVQMGLQYGIDRNDILEGIRTGFNEDLAVLKRRPPAEFHGAYAILLEETIRAIYFAYEFDPEEIAVIALGSLSRMATPFGTDIDLLILLSEEAAGDAANRRQLTGKLREFVEDVDAIVPFGADFPAKIKTAEGPIDIPTVAELKAHIDQFEGVGISSLLDNRYLSGNQAIYDQFRYDVGPAAAWQQEVWFALDIETPGNESGANVPAPMRLFRTVGKLLERLNELPDKELTFVGGKVDDIFNEFGVQAPHDRSHIIDTVLNERDRIGFGQEGEYAILNLINHYLLDGLDRRVKVVPFVLEDYKIKNGPSGLKVLSLLGYIGRTVKGLDTWEWHSETEGQRVFGDLVRILREKGFDWFEVEADRESREESALYASRYFGRELTEDEDLTVVETQQFLLRLRTASNLAWEEKLGAEMATARESSNPVLQEEVKRHKDHYMHGQIGERVAELLGFPDKETVRDRIVRSHFFVQALATRIIDRVGDDRSELRQVEPENLAEAYESVLLAVIAAQRATPEAVSSLVTAIRAKGITGEEDSGGVAQELFDVLTTRLAALAAALEPTAFKDAAVRPGVYERSLTFQLEHPEYVLRHAQFLYESPVLLESLIHAYLQVNSQLNFSFVIPVPENREVQRWLVLFLAKLNDVINSGRYRSGQIQAHIGLLGSGGQFESVRPFLGQLKALQLEKLIDVSEIRSDTAETTRALNKFIGPQGNTLLFTSDAAHYDSLTRQVNREQQYRVIQLEDLLFSEAFPIATLLIFEVAGINELTKELLEGLPNQLPVQDKVGIRNGHLVIFESARELVLEATAAELIAAMA
ncbi:MAG: putative PEP-binding protein [Candidatus Omnitrophota bacterium]|nr:putative PEP-binding protein [Candidatus Omnitrophota bacterium]